MQTEAIGDLREEICVRKSYNLQFANNILKNRLDTDPC
jgi:hypothetical protein